VYCSPWTAKVAPIVLLDAARLQEEDADYAADHRYSKHHPPLPLFDTADAEKAISLLRPVPFGQSVTVAPDIRLKLHRAGHILGSSIVEVHAANRSVVFSGDLGREAHPLLNPPEPAPAADAIVVESTYGGQAHHPRHAEDIAAPIRETIARGGSVLIPAFAVDRTPVLLMVLRELIRTGELPSIPVYVDSPMALAALDVYREAVREGGTEIRRRVHEMHFDPFDPGELHAVHSAEESQAAQRTARAEHHHLRLGHGHGRPGRASPPAHGARSQTLDPVAGLSRCRVPAERRFWTVRPR
jgi:metallo-beta-lactamase family protein